MHKISFCFFLTVFMGISLSLYSQEQDSLEVRRNKNSIMFGELEGMESIQTADTTHSPRKAALYSAILPGAGQFYNQKYWKIPLVYALGAFAAYQIKSNHQNYMLFRNVYVNIVDGNPNNNDDYQAFTDRGLDTETIKRRLEVFKRDRDYWIILAGLFYVLNIVDATVDAHLREFSLNENLSMRVQPSLQSNPYQNMQAGISLSFVIKGKNTK